MPNLRSQAQRIAAYNAEIARRDLRYSEPLVLTLPSDPSNRTDDGFIFVAVAPRGDTALVDIIDAVRKGEHVRFARLASCADHMKTLHELLTRRSIRSLGEQLSRIGLPGRERFSFASIPVFGEMRYATKTLVSGLFVAPLVNISSVWLPYNGGKLDQTAFRFVEYSKEGTGLELEAVVVVSEPRLTALERQILAQVPAEKSEINIGAPVEYLAREVVEGIVVGLLVELVEKILDAAWHAIQQGPQQAGGQQAGGQQAGGHQADQQQQAGGMGQGGGQAQDADQGGGGGGGGGGDGDDDDGGYPFQAGTPPDQAAGGQQPPIVEVGDYPARDVPEARHPRDKARRMREDDEDQQEVGQLQQAPVMAEGGSGRSLSGDLERELIRLPAGLAAARLLELRTNLLIRGARARLGRAAVKK